MVEQKTKKSGIAKKLRRNILSPCIKGSKTKETRAKVRDLDSIDSGTLSFDSSKYLKNKGSLRSLNTNTRVASPLSIETEAPDSYLKKKNQTSEKTEKALVEKEVKEKEKEKENSDKQLEINDVESSDSDDDVPLSQCISKKQSPPLTQNNNANSSTTINTVKPNSLTQESTKVEKSTNMSLPSSENITEEVVTNINDTKGVTTQTISREDASEMKHPIENKSLKIQNTVDSKAEVIETPNESNPVKAEVLTVTEPMSINKDINLTNPSNNDKENEKLKSSEEIVEIQTSIILPENIKTENNTNSGIIEPKKMKLTVVNTDEDSNDDDSDDDDSDDDDSDDDDSDNEKLFTIKQKHDQSKLELEENKDDATLESSKLKEGNKEVVKENIKDMKKEVKDEVEKEIEDLKELKEELKEVKEEVKEVKEEVKEVKDEVKEEAKEKMKEETKEKVKEETKKEVKEEAKEKVEEEIKEKAEEEEIEEDFSETEEEFTDSEDEEENAKKLESEKSKMDEFKDQITSSFKKHKRSLSSSMSSVIKKVDQSFEQTKEHIKENLCTDSSKSKSKNNNILTEDIIGKQTTPINKTENENVSHNYASSETSFQDTLMGSLKRNNNGAKSIKNFFGFGKKDKKNKHKKEDIPEFPIDNLKINTGAKKDSAKEIHSPFSSLKRIVSPLSKSKRRNSNSSLKSKKESAVEKTDTIKIQSETKNSKAEKTDKQLTVPVTEPAILKPNNNIDNNNNLDNKNNTDNAVTDMKDKVVKEDNNDNASIHSSCSSASNNSVSSVSSGSSASSSSSSSSSSDDDEVLGNIINKKISNNTAEDNNSTITNNNNNNNNNNISNNINLNKNYTNGNVDNDDFVSIMMVQRLLSSSVDRSQSLIPENPSSPVSEIQSPTLNPYSFIDLESERNKSYAKPKAVVTAVNPLSKEDSLDSPRSTIIYRFDDKPKFEKPNLYKNELASRSVGSLPLSLENKETSNSSEKINSDKSKQRMIELNLDNSIIIEDKEKNTTDSNNRKSVKLDSDLMRMFDDIHNLSLDDIATRYTKPSMISCDIGPSFLDEVMDSLPME